MSALAGLRDPFGIALALATGLTIVAIQEGVVLGAICAAAVVAFRVGVEPLVGRARPLARTTAAATDDVFDPLTRREVGIAELVSRGLTNREIADRLVISERTVDNHVFHIMNKLNVHSRTEIGVWLVQRQMRASANIRRHS